MGSWKGRGNQYIEFTRVVYCKLPTNSKQLPAFPLEPVRGSIPGLRGGRRECYHSATVAPERDLLPILVKLDYSCQLSFWHTGFNSCIGKYDKSIIGLSYAYIL